MTWLSNRISRRAVMRGAVGATIAAPFIGRGPALAATVPNIRYATGGGIGPNEMETIIFLDHLKKNVLKKIVAENCETKTAEEAKSKI